MEEKISVIMSLYNAEKTVKNSIMSIIEQSYNNIELIVINDCSTDNSLNIVEALAKQYSNIKIINNNINKGCGMSRRIGVKNATGNYIGFLDSDDRVYKDFYKTLYTYLKNNDGDIIISQHQSIYDFNTYAKPAVKGVEIHIGDDIFLKKCEDKMWFNASLSKKSIWDNFDYSSLRFIEDTPTMYRLLTKVSKLIFLDYKGYFYYINPNSLMHTSSQLKKAVYRVLATMEILDWISNKKVKNKKVFIIRLNELGNILKTCSYREAKQYNKELFKIAQYFINKII